MRTLTRSRVALSGVTMLAGQCARLSGDVPHPWRYEADGPAVLSADVRGLTTKRRPWLWSTRDVAAFAALAMWNYLNLPFLLLDPRFDLELLPGAGDTLRRLRVGFPAAVTTHSAQQVLHIDANGLIRRHDYTARAIGRWAVASQLLDRYHEYDGFLVATRRRVTPRAWSYRLTAPTLVSIDIHDLRFV